MGEVIYAKVFTKKILYAKIKTGTITDLR